MNVPNNAQLEVVGAVVRVLDAYAEQIRTQFAPGLIAMADSWCREVERMHVEHPEIFEPGSGPTVS